MLPDLANKNTGCPIAFEFQIFNTNLELTYMKSEVTQLCPTLCNPMDTRLLHPWDFLGKSTGVGCHCLLLSKLASLTICLLFQSVAMAASLLMKNSACSLSSPGTRRPHWEQQLWPKQVFSTQVSQQSAPSSCLAAQ